MVLRPPIYKRAQYELVLNFSARTDREKERRTFQLALKKDLQHYRSIQIWVKIDHHDRSKHITVAGMAESM